MHRTASLAVGVLALALALPSSVMGQASEEPVEPEEPSSEASEGSAPSPDTDQPDDSPAEVEPASEEPETPTAEEQPEVEEQPEEEAPSTPDPGETSTTSGEGEAVPEDTTAEGNEEAPAPTRPQVDRVLSTVEDEAQPSFVFWESERFNSFIKPMIQVSSSLVGYFPNSSTNPDLANRASTLLLVRLGFEGQLFRYITFRVGFERNIGFSLARNGPVGTGVWEGTASMQSLENYVQLSRWGVSLTGGIFLDPPSLDYISENILGLLGKDPYVREPLLMSGMNQGQGVRLSYTWRGLSVGFSYTGGNPLTSSLAYGFGGDVTASGSLYRAPLRDFTLGFPGSNIHMNVLSPSVSFENDFIGIRAAAQIYFVDADVTIEDDLSLFGYNFRGSMQVVLLDGMLRFFAGGSYRQNQQLAIPDLTTYRPDAFKGFVVSGGFDFSYRDFSIGGNYFFVWNTPSTRNTTTTHYVNVGATYWFFRPYVSIGLRWGRSMQRRESTTADPTSVDTDSAILSLRLLI